MFTAKLPLMFLQVIHFAAVILFRYERKSLVAQIICSGSGVAQFRVRRVSIGCLVVQSRCGAAQFGVQRINEKI
jgi:hypothetical protein